MAMTEFHATSIQDYHACPRLFKYRHSENLVPKVQDVKLWLGKGVHLGLQAYYCQGTQRGEHPSLVFRRWVEEELEKPEMRQLLEEEVIEFKKKAEVLELVLNQYVEWAEETDPLYIAEVLHTEVEFGVPILEPVSEEETGLYHVGRLDAVVRDPYGRIWIMDHKTCSQFPNQTVLRLDEQMGYYLLAAHYLFPDYQIAGVLYNAIKKTDPRRTRSEQFKRFQIVRNGYEIGSIQRHLYNNALEILHDQNFEPHPGRHCSWRCPFTNLCIAEEDGSDVELLKNSLFERREPELILAYGGDEE